MFYVQNPRNFKLSENHKNNLLLRDYIKNVTLMMGTAVELAISQSTQTIVFNACALVCKKFNFELKSNNYFVFYMQNPRNLKLFE